MENLIVYLIAVLTLVLIITWFLVLRKNNSKIISGIIGISGILGILGILGISVILGFISIIIGIISIIIGIIGILVIDIKKDSRQNKKIKENYPKLSIIGIMRERKDNQKINTIYLLLIATIIYIFASNFFDFAISNIFLCVLLGSVLLIALELLIFNYRVNQGWYGSSELEAREIIDFIKK